MHLGRPFSARVGLHRSVPVDALPPVGCRCDVLCRSVDESTCPVQSEQSAAADDLRDPSASVSADPGYKNGLIFLK